MSYASMHAWKATYSHSFATALPSRPPSCWQRKTLDIIYTQILFTKAPSIPNTNWPRKEQQWPPANPIQNLPTKNKNQGQQKKALPTLRTVPKTSNLVDPQTVRWVPFVLATTSRHVMGCGSSKCRRDRTYRVGEVWESCPRDLV